MKFKKLLAALALIPLAALPAAPAASSASTAAPAAPVVSVSAAPSLGLPYDSSSWGGYLANAPKNTTINAVGAEWTVPKVTLSGHVGSKPFEAVMWVGMDGYGTKIGPEQCGLWIDNATSNGQLEYWMFYELAPAYPKAFTTDGNPLAKDEHNLLRVKPGEQISALVQYFNQPGFKWNHDFSFTVSVGSSYYDQISAPGTPAPLRHQAEVITEIPSENGHPVGALDLGRVSYSYAEYSLSSSPDTVLAVNQHAVFTIYTYPGGKQGFRIIPGTAIASNPPRIENGHALKDYFTTRITTWGS